MPKTSKLKMTAIRIRGKAARETIMKKYMLVLVLALASMGMAFAAPTSVSGTLAVNGQINSVMTVVATAGSTLSLDPAGSTTGAAYGTVAVSSNRQSWTIGLSSANGGYLEDTTKAYKIGYAMQISGTVGGSTVTVGDLSSVTGTWSTSTYSKPVSGKQLTAATMNTLIGYAAESAATTSNWKDGTAYTDTVTITLTAQ
jgi:hypothetical protein